MTPEQSRSRFMLLYCAAAFLNHVAGNWDKMEQATAYQWTGMILQATVALVIAARAFVEMPTPSNKP